MASSSLIELAKKLHLTDVSGSEYIDAFIECNTTSNSKQFIIPVSDEGFDKVARELDKIDWFNQKGSDSYNEIITDELTTAFKTGKSSKRKPSRTFAGIRISRYNKQISKTSKSLILSTINKMLALQVKKHMYAPRLVYRTGRFANSVKILDIEESKNNNLTFIYSWQRSPYSVFSKYYGKQPWQTPARDPDDLSVLAISELVKQYFKERVYYRRAW